MNEYLNKYPWLSGYDPYPEDGEEKYCIASDMPSGWMKTFGDMFFEELDAAIKDAHLENEFEVIQLKEKFGRMRFYYHPSTGEIDNIVRKYEELSGNICITCGKPDVAMLNHFGWLSPYCRHCFEEINRGRRIKSYDELVIGEETMSDAVHFVRYGRYGNQEFKMDISETARAIRLNWENNINKETIYNG